MRSVRRIVCALAYIGFTTQLALADLPATYTDSSQAKQLIEGAMRLPQSQNATKIFYAAGISLFDGFIPVNPLLNESPVPHRSNVKFTFHDGRISSAEAINGAGQVTETWPVWNNVAGAPVLSAARDKDGSYGWYMYGEYDSSSGKIQKLYRFSQTFELLSYRVFSYQGDVTSIQDYASNSQPGSKTIYDHGDVYVVENGDKRLVNHVDRKKAIHELEKFGLKPLYPVY